MEKYFDVAETSSSLSFLTLKSTAAAATLDASVVSTSVSSGSGMVSWMPSFVPLLTYPTSLSPVEPVPILRALEEEEEINLLLLLHPQWAVEGHIYMYSYIPIERDIVSSSSSSSSSTSTAYRCAPPSCRPR